MFQALLLVKNLPEQTVTLQRLLEGSAFVAIQVVVKIAYNQFL